MLKRLSYGTTGSDLIVCKFNSLNAALLLIFANAAESLKACSVEITVVEVDCVFVFR